MYIQTFYTYTMVPHQVHNMAHFVEQDPRGMNFSDAWDMKKVRVFYCFVKETCRQISGMYCN